MSVGAQRVALRMPSWLGDFVMAEPVARALWRRASERDAAENLTLIAPTPFLELLRESMPGARLHGVSGQREGAAHYRGHQLAVFLNGSFGSVYAALRAGVPQRVGWGNGGRSALLSVALVRAAERGGRPLGWGRRPRRRRYLPRPFTADCVELALVAGFDVLGRRPRITPTAKARALWQQRRQRLGLVPEQEFFLVAAGARKDSAKGYPPAAWIEVLESLAQMGAPPLVLVGGPGEEPCLAAIEAGARRATPVALLDPVADLGELAACAAQASLVLCADGGTRHVAKAVGAETITIFGPTDPRHTCDHGEGESVLRAFVPCSPCHLERCPLDGPDRHACMFAVDPQGVAREAIRRWSGTHESRPSTQPIYPGPSRSHDSSPG